MSLQKSKLISFDFWQKFGKALLVVVAVMPAAGLMISLGKVLGIFLGGSAIINLVGHIVEDMGWGIIVNLNLLFAVAIGGSWAYDTFLIAKEKDSGITVKGNIDGWDQNKNDLRLDLILANEKLDVKYSKVIFNGINNMVVSDHYGVEVEIWRDYYGK